MQIKTIKKVNHLKRFYVPVDCYDNNSKYKDCKSWKIKYKQLNK